MSSRRSGARPNYNEDAESSDENGSDKGSGGEDDFEAPKAKVVTPRRGEGSSQGGGPSPSPIAKAKKVDAETGAAASSDDDSSDDEMQRKRRKGKKGKGRKKNVNPLFQLVPGKKKSYPKKAGRLPKVPLFDEEAAADGESLYKIATDKPGSVSIVVEKWWGHYNDPTTKVSAVHEVISLIIEVSGYNISMAPSLFEDDADVDIDDEVAQLVARCSKVDPSDEVWRKTKPSSKIRAGIEDFFLKLALLAPRSQLVVLTDSNLFSWINALSQCAIAYLRHSAVLAGLQMLEGIATVGSESIGDMNIKDRLLKVTLDSAKGVDKAKAERLREDIRELTMVRGHLEEQMDSLVNSLFVLRFRDTNETIRTRCISSLGKTILSLPQKFLTNLYLKYLGWSLNDRHKDARLAALEELTSIYEDDSVSAKALESFTGRFKDRIVEMLHDADCAVSCKAINLCTVLYKGGFVELDDEYWTPVYDGLMYDDHDLGLAVANFITEYYLKSQLANDFDKDESNKDSDRERFMMKGMVELISRIVNDDDNASPNVRDLKHIVTCFESMDDWGLKDWGLMCDLLLDDDEEDGLAEDQRTTLLQLLLASVSLRPTADEVSRNPRAAKGKQTRADATTALIPAMHGLLTGMEDGSVNNTLLMKLVGCLELQAIKVESKKEMSKILELVADTLTKGKDEELIMAASAALQGFSWHTYPLKQMLLPQLSLLVETVARHFVAASLSFIKNGKISAVNALWIKRMTILGNQVDVCSSEYQREVYDAALDMLTFYAEEDSTAEMQDEIACQLIHFCGVSVEWLVEDGFASSEDASETTQALCEAITQRDALLSVLRNIVNSEGLPFPARAQAMFEMCDLMQAFGTGMRDELIEHGAKEEEVLDGDLIMSMCNCGHEEFLKELLVRPKIKKPDSDPVLNDDYYPEDFEDTSHIGKAIVLSSIKPLLFCLEGESLESTSGLVASLVLFPNYSEDFRKKFIQLFDKEYKKGLSDMLVAGCWLQAHQKMFLRILVAAGHDNVDATKLTIAMLESINTLVLLPESLLMYLKHAAQWAISGDSMQVGFLEAIQLHVERLDMNAAKELLEFFDDACKNPQADLRGNTSVASFRDRAIEAALPESDDASEAHTPNRNRRKARVGRGIDTGSEAGDSTPRATPRQRKKEKIASTMRRKKGRKAVSSDEDEVEDEDGFKSAKPPKKMAKDSRSSSASSRMAPRSGSESPTY